MNKLDRSLEAALVAWDTLDSATEVYLAASDNKSGAKSIFVEQITDDKHLIRCFLHQFEAEQYIKNHPGFNLASHKSTIGGVCGSLTSIFKKTSSVKADCVLSMIDISGNFYIIDTLHPYYTN